MRRTVTIAAILMLVCAPAASAQSTAPVSRSQVVWTVAGAGAGFGVGLWAGLTAFDDAINSDRKVWTSAVVGAAVGGVAGYLLGRARHDRARPSTARAESTDQAIDPTLLRELVQSVRFGRPWTTRERRFESQRVGHDRCARVNNHVTCPPLIS